MSQKSLSCRAALKSLCRPLLTHLMLVKPLDGIILYALSGRNNIHTNCSFSSSSTCIQPRSLPPNNFCCTSSHTARLSSSTIDSGMGWTYCHRLGLGCSRWEMVHVSIDLSPVPNYLLGAIHCNCKSACNTRHRKCRKYGLEYSLQCSCWKESHWTNVTLHEMPDDDGWIDNQSWTMNGIT